MSGWPVPTARPRSRATYLALIAIAVLLGLVAVQLISLVDLPFNQVVASMDQRVTVHGRTVNVAGTTDLPDGAVLDYSFWREGDFVAAGDPLAGGEVTINGGRFTFEATLDEVPPGTVTLDTSFSVTDDLPQPPNVIDRFGSTGERLAGPQVFVDSPGDPKRLVVETRFELASAAPAPPSPSAS